MSVKLPKPPPDDGMRSEYEAFLTGFALALVGIKCAYPSFDDRAAFDIAVEAATELYPPFDPFTEAVKCRGDGRRADGIEMSED
jgi:hypothetical protein